MIKRAAVVQYGSPFAGKKIFFIIFPEIDSNLESRCDMMKKKEGRRSVMYELIQISEHDYYIQSPGEDRAGPAERHRGLPDRQRERQGRGQEGAEASGREGLEAEGHLQYPFQRGSHRRKQISAGPDGLPYLRPGNRVRFLQAIPSWSRPFCTAAIPAKI